MVKVAGKQIMQAIAILVAFPFAVLTAFGHLRPMFTFFAHAFANGPGLPGDYLRSAYYNLTLRECSLDTRISYGTYFVQPRCAVGKMVSIGAYCVIGGADIGDATQIGSHVLVPGGRNQHSRDAHGNLSACEFSEIKIGSKCWIGDGAILMADVGAGSTIGAGAVVTKAIPAGVTAVGNPARLLCRDASLGVEERVIYPT